ncbi:MAG TPA: BLUF domain-containing protein [Limnobacter sp.]|nr:BLUF domain-containing protein [Limnobacter sp.]
MLSLVYTSTQNVKMDEHAFSTLCAAASRRNQALGVSGLLLCNGHEFLQCLEGPTLHVSAIYAKIIEDSRHGDIRLLHHQAITQRLFDGWGMVGIMADHPGPVTEDTPYAYLDHRLHRPWHALGVGAVDLLFEYAKVKRSLETMGQRSLLPSMYEITP